MAKRPVCDKLFTEGISGSLLGARCKDCGRLLAPLSRTCCYCRGEALEEVPLSDRGKLYSYTVVYQPHPNFGKSYSVGLIELANGGPRIFAPIGKADGQEFKVGMDVELVVEKLWEEDGNEIIGPRFQPV